MLKKFKKLIKKFKNMIERMCCENTGEKSLPSWGYIRKGLWERSGRRHKITYSTGRGPSHAYSLMDSQHSAWALPWSPGGFRPSLAQGYLSILVLSAVVCPHALGLLLFLNLGGVSLLQIWCCWKRYGTNKWTFWRNHRSQQMLDFWCWKRIKAQL